MCRTDDELPRIRSRFGNYGAGLAPDDLGPAGAEAAVSTEGQLARRAVEVAVASFHGVDRQPIARSPPADRDRLKYRHEVRLEREPERRSLRGGEQGVAGLVLEEAGRSDGSPGWLRGPGVGDSRQVQLGAPASRAAVIPDRWWRTEP